MLIANFEKHCEWENFFPSHKIDFLKYGSSRSSEVFETVKTQLLDQNLIVFGGTKILESYYGGHTYSNAEKIDYYETVLYDLAHEKKIPMIGINRGYNLIGMKLGYDFRVDTDTENHVNIFNSSVYGVNSHHTLVCRSGRGEVTNADSYDELFYYPQKKIMAVAWSPEMEDCPESGIKLFDILLNKYLGITR